MLSILIVSAERCSARPRGSGSPVNGASRTGFIVVVVTGVVVVVDDVVELVEVVVLVVLVVVKSADAPDATRRVGPKTESIKRLSNRRILKN